MNCVMDKSSSSWHSGGSPPPELAVWGNATLIKKGMVYSPSHGEMAFTVPLFDEFMRRAMPEFEPR